MRGKFHKGATFAGTVWSSQYRALFNGSERVKQLSYILLGLLLAKHANEKLSISEAFAFVSSALLALCLFVADGDGERQILKRIPGFTFGFSFFALGRDTKVLFVFVISCVGFFLRRMGCMCLLS